MTNPASVIKSAVTYPGSPTNRDRTVPQGILVPAFSPGPRYA